MDPNEGAIVLYQGPEAPSSNDQNEETKSYSEKPTNKYIGLGNQGATCYMNSLLQSLFMTYEFRSMFYQWRYNAQEHAKPQDCIPLQLQKIFAGLQLKLRPYVGTQGLTKSFQWDSSHSYEQQDVQEFNRILFDAIEQATKFSPIENFINDLYEGTSINYVECLECHNESTRMENFLDLNLTVKNQFDKVYNDCLEKALQLYLKPELLTGSNQYFCEKCNKKVDAKRGARFLKLPKLLCTIVNRFSFDYIYMKRVKLDDFFSFPFILNMNDYINGYDGIKNKYPEESNPDYFKEEKANYIPKSGTSLKKNSSSTSSTSTKGTSNKTTSVVTTKPARSSDATRNFMQEMRKKKSQEAKNKNVDVLIFSKDDEIAGGLGNPPPLLEVNHVTAMYGNPSKNNPQNNQDVVLDIGTSDTKGSENSTQASKQQSTEDNADKSTDTQTDSRDSAYYVKSGEKFSVNDLKGMKKPQPTEEETEEARKKREERENQRKEERKQLIDKYLQEGPLVYELYSILIHSGGAYGGHYYAFIKSFEDGKWYNFNDMTVREIDPDTIPSQTFGGNKSANAYMLLYRQVESSEEKLLTIKTDEIPEDLRKTLEEEAKKEEHEETERMIRSRNVHVKVYHKLESKQIPTNMDEKFSELERKAFEAYGIKDTKNSRLRIYQPHTDTMQDTFTNKGDKTLQELKIFSSKCMCIETKKDEEEFEEFDADTIYFKVAQWRRGLSDLSEETLQPKKVPVNKDGVLKDLMESISKEFNIPVNNIRLVKKVQAAGLPIPEVLSTPENMERKFFACKIFEGLLLYIERIESPEDAVQWKEEFELDSFRYKIKFNSPYTDSVTESATQEYPHSVIIDARLSISALKEQVCQQLGVKENEIILRKGGRMGIEIKDVDQTITSAGFVSGSSIYVEFGRPTKLGEMRLIVYLAEKNDKTDDDLVSHFYKELFESIIHGENTAAEVKAIICSQAKEKYGYDWEPAKIRLREKVSDKMVRVYRNSAMKMQGVTDKKQVAVEVLDHEEKIGPKENLIICRVWNPLTLDLGPRFEIIVDKNATLKQLGEKILEKEPSIPLESLMGCKLLGVWKFLRYDLIFQEWHPLNDEQNIVYNHPFYVSADGGLLILSLKDKTIAGKELTEEEKKRIGVTKNQHRAQSVGGYGTYRPAQEKSMKITVKKKEDYEKEEKEALEIAKNASNSDQDNGKKTDEVSTDTQTQGDDEFRPFF